MNKTISNNQSSVELFDNLSFLDVSRLASILSVSAQTVRYWIYRREIPFYKIGRHIRFDPQEIQKWISERRQAYECGTD